MNTKQILGIIGSLLLVAGVFSPVVSWPLIGGMSYFRIDEVSAVFLLSAGVASFFLALTNQCFMLWLTGLASAGAMVLAFMDFQSQDRGFLSTIATEYAQFGWGSVLLFIGVALLFTSATIPEAPTVERPDSLRGLQSSERLRDSQRSSDSRADPSAGGVHSGGEARNSINAARDCPYCSESIRASARLCKHCHSAVTPIAEVEKPPATSQEPPATSQVTERVADRPIDPYVRPLPSQEKPHSAATGFALASLLVAGFLVAGLFVLNTSSDADRGLPDAEGGPKVNKEKNRVVFGKISGTYLATYADKPSMELFDSWILQTKLRSFLSKDFDDFRSSLAQDNPVVLQDGYIVGSGCVRAGCSSNAIFAINKETGDLSAARVIDGGEIRLYGVRSGRELAGPVRDWYGQYRNIGPAPLRLQLWGE